MDKESQNNNFPKEDESSKNSKVIFIEEESDNGSNDPFKYVKNDDEEEQVMQKFADDYGDYELTDALITGEYFSNKKFMGKKRKEYGVVREKKKKSSVIYGEYELKYFKKLEQIYDRERDIDTKNKDYEEEYYRLLEIKENMQNEITDLRKQVKGLGDELLKCQKEKRKLVKDNERKDLKIVEIRDEFHEEKKKIFKKAMIKCPTCFNYFYKSDIVFTGCKHYFCGPCFHSFNGNLCPMCRTKIVSVEVTHYVDDLTSVDFNNYENDEKN